MNGYGSQPKPTPTMFRVIQMTTSRVCQNRNVPVPMKRARFSENRPKVSGSMSTANRRALRG